MSRTVTPPGVTPALFDVVRRRLNGARPQDLSPAVMSSPPTRAFSGPGGASPINSGSPDIVPWKTSGMFTLLGARLTKYASAEAGENATNGAWTPGMYAIEFDYYGSDFALRFVNRAGTTTCWLWVDGVPATSGGDIYVQAASNSISFYRVTFSGAAQRRIRIYVSYFALAGVDINPTDSISPTRKPLGRLAIYGDSWEEATGATSVVEGLACTVGRNLGMETFHHGQGGTGYVNNAGGGTKANYADATRIAAVAADNPDLIVITGSSNDDAQTPATVGTNAAAIFAAFAAQVPKARIYVIGPPMLTSTSISGRVAVRDQIKAACAAAPNVIGFLDPLDCRDWPNSVPTTYAQGTVYAVGDVVTSGNFTYECRIPHTGGASLSTTNFRRLTLITGTGRVGATNGSGNSDLMIANDSTHPSPAGHDYFGREFSEAILRRLSVLALS